MTSSTVTLKLVLMLAMTATTTLAFRHRFRPKFRLASVASLRRKPAYPPPHVAAVLSRLDRLSTLIHDLSASVDQVQEAVNHINSSVNPTVVQPCEIEMQSVGYMESESTYVRINGADVLQLTSPSDDTNPECGIYTVLLDKAKCGIKELKFFGTHWSTAEADRFATYLYYLPFNQHVLLTTLGEPFANMTDRAFDALSSVGIDIGDVARPGQTFTALIVVGSHCATVFTLFDAEDLAQLSLHLSGAFSKGGSAVNDGESILANRREGKVTDGMCGLHCICPTDESKVLLLDKTIKNSSNYKMITAHIGGVEQVILFEIPTSRTKAVTESRASVVCLTKKGRKTAAADTQAGGCNQTSPVDCVYNCF